MIGPTFPLAGERKRAKMLRMGGPADQTAADEHFMAIALREGRKGVGLTTPNPPVGAAIVKNGRLIATGWHHRAGGAHAEINALKAVGRQARGATLYVTLEPCSTHGRTGACTGAVAAAGIKRVVYGCADPNPAHARRGRQVMEKAGIAVTEGIRGAECAALIRPWAKFITTGRPWVIAKAGVSLDGKISRPPGEGQWLTDDASRADAMKLRRRADAIIVGAQTVRKDNPSLTIRPPWPPKTQPWRVVMTKTGRLPDNAAIFTDDFSERTVVAAGQELPGILEALATAPEPSVTVLIEGGGTILAQAFAKRLVDEVCFYIAPLLCVTGRPVLDPAYFSGGSIGFEQARWKTIGSCVRFTALVAPEGR